MPNEMSAEQVIKNLAAYMYYALDDMPKQAGESISAAISILRKIDRGELVEVVHGEWLNFVGDFSTAECNKCGEIYEVSPDGKPCEDYFNAFKQFYRFCPSCGAKMDGKDDSHETD